MLSIYIYIIDWAKRSYSKTGARLPCWPWRLVENHFTTWPFLDTFTDNHALVLTFLVLHFKLYDQGSVKFTWVINTRICMYGVWNGLFDQGVKVRINWSWLYLMKIQTICNFVHNILHYCYKLAFHISTSRIMWLLEIPLSQENVDFEYSPG